MKIYYYSNQDKLDDKSVPEILESQGHEVSIDYVRPELEWLNKHQIEFIISDRARFLVRKDVIEQYPNKIINLHPSFLPWCKGYNPIIAGLIKNQCLGVTIHHINAGIDTGDILLQSPIHVSENDTLRTLYDKHRETMLLMLKDNLDDLLTNKITSLPQHPLLGSLHKKDQFPVILDKLPNSWDTSATWVRENLTKELD